MIRRIIGFFFACALVIVGLSAILYFFSEGGIVGVFIMGLILFLGGLYWLKEDYFDPILAWLRGRERDV
jgi:hypothetical protein